VLGILELDTLRVRRVELGRRCGHLAVSRLAVRRAMRDDAVGHADFADRHLPLIGRGLQEHDARSGAAATHVIFGGADAAATSRSHLAPDALSRETLAGGNKICSYV